MTEWERIKMFRSSCWEHGRRVNFIEQEGAAQGYQNLKCSYIKSENTIYISLSLTDRSAYLPLSILMQELEWFVDEKRRAKEKCERMRISIHKQREKMELKKRKEGENQADEWQTQKSTRWESLTSEKEKQKSNPTLWLFIVWLDLAEKQKRTSTTENNGRHKYRQSI